MGVDMPKIRGETFMCGFQAVKCAKISYGCAFVNDSAGTDNIISTTPSMVDDAAVDNSQGSEVCRKNIREPKRLR